MALSAATLALAFALATPPLLFEAGRFFKLLFAHSLPPCQLRFDIIPHGLLHCPNTEVGGLEPRSFRQHAIGLCQKADHTSCVP